VARKPLIVAVGPFGAGKSTCVRRLARQALARGIRPVLVSWQWDPFDEANDRDEGVETVAAVRGGADPAALLRAAGEGAGEWALVHAPGEMGVAEALAICGEAADLFEPPRIVGILDSQRSPLPDAARLAGAAGILLNKVDTAAEGATTSLMGALAERLGGIPVVATVESTITIEELWDWPRARAAGAAAPSTGAGPAKCWVSWSGALARSAAQLFAADPPPGTLRAKGIFAVEGEPGLQVLQVTGRSGGLRRCHLSSPPPQGILWIAENPKETDLWARLGLEARVEPLAAP
jgi:hypothetical protein